MATVSDYIEQLKAYLPGLFSARDELLAIFAGAMVEVLSRAETLASLVDIGTSTGIWLTLLARSYGIERATNEPDAALRERIRNLDEALTVQSIEDAVNALLDPYTATLAYIVEHWSSGPVLDIEEDPPLSFVVGSTTLWDDYLGFTLYVPDLGDEHEVYAAIYAEVERIRAAGTRWRMVIQA